VRRTAKRGLAALTAEHDSRWLSESRRRGLFDSDLEPGEQVALFAEVTLEAGPVDRPVGGWAVATDRALRVRWARGSSVRQSMHVGYDRVRWVEVGTDDPCSAYVVHFDAGRTAVSWYQDLRLRGDSPSLAMALPRLVSEYHRTAVRSLLDQGPTPAAAPAAGSLRPGDVVAPPPQTSLTAEVRRRRLRRLVRR
jgi:hypothetical protein